MRITTVGNSNLSLQCSISERPFYRVNKTITREVLANEFSYDMKVHLLRFSLRFNFIPLLERYFTRTEERRAGYPAPTRHTWSIPVSLEAVNTKHTPHPIPRTMVPPGFHQDTSKLDHCSTLATNRLKRSHTNQLTWSLSAWQLALSTRPQREPCSEPHPWWVTINRAEGRGKLIALRLGSNNLECIQAVIVKRSPVEKIINMTQPFCTVNFSALGYSLPLVFTVKPSWFKCPGPSSMEGGRRRFDLTISRPDAATSWWQWLP